MKIKKMIKNTIESTGQFLKKQLCVDEQRQYYEDNRDEIEEVGRNICNNVGAYISQYTNEENCLIF